MQVIRILRKKRNEREPGLLFTITVHDLLVNVVVILFEGNVYCKYVCKRVFTRTYKVGVTLEDGSSKKIKPMSGGTHGSLFSVRLDERGVNNGHQRLLGKIEWRNVTLLRHRYGGW